VGLSGGFVERDLASIRLQQWGRVVEAEGVVPWLVVGPDGNVVEPVQRFLRDFVARGNRAGSVRSYAYGLLRWWRWLAAVGVDWDKATSAEVRDFVLWLGQAAKPRTSPRTASAATAGTVNAVTRKRYLGDQYEPRTVRHGNAVLRSFYEFWIELGGGPLAVHRGGGPVRQLGQQREDAAGRQAVHRTDPVPLQQPSTRYTSAVVDRCA
jgi:Phage integrase, N-terminal SAM-like domain